MGADIYCKEQKKEVKINLFRKNYQDDGIRILERNRNFAHNELYMRL